MTLDPAFLSRPLTHRALHDVADGRPENSRAAMLAAIEKGYGIELDLQLSQDGEAMVFHDYPLDRLAEASGPLAMQTAENLGKILLKGGNEGIPTLPEILALVAGRVPLMIELKDQHGQMGETDGRLEAATAAALKTYLGPTALMSFNPHTVARLAKLCPNIPRGLTTAYFSAELWPILPKNTRATLREIPDYNRVCACFISHDARDLTSPHLARIKATGAPILCWTIHSAAEEKEARKIADNITFEAYLAKTPT